MYHYPHDAEGQAELITGCVFGLGAEHVEEPAIGAMPFIFRGKTGFMYRYNGDRVFEVTVMELEPVSESEAAAEREG